MYRIDFLRVFVYTICIYIIERSAIMVTAKVFQSGNSQAIRIPNEYRTKEKEFFIRKFGDGFYLVPTNDPWMLLRNSLGKVSDLEFEREQPEMESLPKREKF